MPSIYPSLLPSFSRCISYGSPPVYRPPPSSEGSKNPQLFSVVYNNDGLASASVASVTKLFMQIREVDRLRMRRRDILRMLWNPVRKGEGETIF